MRRRSLTRVFCLTLLGVLLLQAAWILTVPPFRGLDEHDHAFKAAASARGDWQPHHRAASDGWGEFMRVPADIVAAAAPICESLTYTSAANCATQAPLVDGSALVATSAARYNPAFYTVIGAVALPFDGVAALYAMRTAAALMCALLIAGAMTIASSWARSRWVPAGVLLALTPVVAYSTAVAAPNGVELSAAFLLWASLLGLTRVDPHGDRVPLYVTTATVAGVLLATVRTLGPLWLVLIVGVCAMLCDRAHLAALARRRALQVGVVATAVLGSFGPAWSLVAGTNSVTDTGHEFTGVWGAIPGQWVLWFFQSIAAFPARDEMAPLAVYAIALALMWAFAALAWRVGRRRERWAMVAVFVVTTTVAVGVTVASYREAGTLWQGRYGYPFALGLFLIAGAALDRSEDDRPRATSALLLAGTASAVMTSIGILKVLSHEKATSPFADSSAWPAPSAFLVVLLVVLGAVAMVVGALQAEHGDADPGASARHPEPTAAGRPA